MDIIVRIGRLGRANRSRRAISDGNLLNDAVVFVAAQPPRRQRAARRYWRIRFEKMQRQRNHYDWTAGRGSNIPFVLNTGIRDDDERLRARYQAKQHMLGLHVLRRSRIGLPLEALLLIAFNLSPDIDARSTGSVANAWHRWWFSLFNAYR
eukprot:gnl/TRDRNA2_/TRDRNA2_177550_c2_seq19.p1 gnl/TRDRNA2_/TRDRNA2_177550_c2~~gnl/TRDRNA2_/TRDRNA2_177550_c2_seq19.p1  ORF type:complete len:151 (-),score=10.79 gnl/TRDRNA2_/TRDRNA2_177550_c2_seq19:124-576(-)